MHVAVPCPSCKSIFSCDCSRALVSFFGHLERANERVLRLETSSRIEHLPVLGAGLDKLDAYFAEPIKAEEISEKAKHLKYRCESVFLRDKRPYIKIIQENQFIHLKLSIEGSHVVKMTTNPNRFKSWDLYSSFIQSIFSQETIKRAKICRLDFNLDFSAPFPLVIQSLDIKNKRCSVSFNDGSGVRTGIIVGKGEEVIEVYDKAMKDKLDSPFTRLELRLCGSKLPTREILKIPSILQEVNPFEGLEGVKLAFLNEGGTDEQLQKINGFKMILEREGLYSAKKLCNRNRNFDRDFTNLVEFKQWNLQPTQLYKNEIKRFLEPQNRQITGIQGNFD